MRIGRDKLGVELEPVRRLASGRQFRSLYLLEMDLWDRDALDLVAPAFIEFQDGSGSFGFIAVSGWLDCREVEIDGRTGVEFTWDGADEGDQVSGRGWAKQRRGSWLPLWTRRRSDAPWSRCCCSAPVSERLARLAWRQNPARASFSVPDSISICSEDVSVSFVSS